MFPHLVVGSGANHIHGNPLERGSDDSSGWRGAFLSCSVFVCHTPTIHPDGAHAPA